MARLRRTRWILKWVGLILSLLVAVVWAVSYSPFVLCWFGTSGGVMCSDGRIHQPFAGQRPAILEPGVQFIGQSAMPATDDFSVPLWGLFLVVALPTVFLWWRDRRRIPPGHCRNCGYDLTGNVSGVCPECGMALSSERPGGESET